MSKYCVSCGKELKENAKYCGRCGTKVPPVPVETFSNRMKTSEPYSSPSGSSTRKYRSQTEGKSNILNQESISTYTHAAKKKGMGIIQDIKNFKSLPPQRKKRLLTICIPILVIVIGICILVPSLLGGVSDEVVGEAALNIAEQDYGYSLELSSFEIVDSFTAKADNLMSGDKITAKTFLVVLDAVAKDSAGTPVEEVTYGVVVVEPEKSDEHVTYNPMSNAQNCSGMSVEDVTEALKESTAHLR